MHLVKLPRPSRLALIAFLLLPCAIGFADDKPAAQQAPAVPVDPYAISLEFPGGPLSKLVASLDTGKDSRLSIIQSAGLDPILPAFSVHNARIDAVIAALGQIVEPQGYRLNPIGPNLAVLSRVDTSRSQSFASFQLEHKIGTRTAEEIVAAIQLGCEFANPDQKASTLRFKYHPGTKLLFVAGTRQEIDVAHQVFGSLPDNPPQPPAAPADKK